ncbi:MAG: hypothetical protein ACRDKF_16805 [Actinomycetota bacterium]
MSNVFQRLEHRELISGTPRGKGAVWTLTPQGKADSLKLISEIDLVALEAEMATDASSDFGHTTHPLIPPALAPPELIDKLREFADEYSFDLSVFGMTRFPDEQEDEKGPDPVQSALDVAKDVCEKHGLKFHLADDQAFSDDLWTNVAGHMWASRYGIAFFENRRERGVNYNLTMEVGSMLMTGRRCALLKDTSVKTLPTDLVGKIYKKIDLNDLDSVAKQLHSWIRDDLHLGPCSVCA